MSGRGKEFMGYKVSDTDLLVGALVIFVAVRVRSVPLACGAKWLAELPGYEAKVLHVSLQGTAWARRPGTATTKVLKSNATAVRLRAKEAAKHARREQGKGRS